jgi:exodeoxyribonuclease-3
LHALQLRKPVIFTGDLNCGFLDLDIHNAHAKHIVKQAGLTAEERSSFNVLLTEGGGFVDAFRYFYPGECYDLHVSS